MFLSKQLWSLLGLGVFGLVGCGGADWDQAANEVDSTDVATAEEAEALTASAPANVIVDANTPRRANTRCVGSGSSAWLQATMSRRVRWRASAVRGPVVRSLRRLSAALSNRKDSKPSRSSVRRLNFAACGAASAQWKVSLLAWAASA